MWGVWGGVSVKKTIAGRGEGGVEIVNKMGEGNFKQGQRSKNYKLTKWCSADEILL